MFVETVTKTNLVLLGYVDKYDRIVNEQNDRQVIYGKKLNNEYKTFRGHDYKSCLNSRHYVG